ncbi:hypothetical protein [Bradyrhizobium sp.]|uniref:hypothetical protein n=1 Tax=Bradyrhizobium sp. TaxID=376 RepID=UPI0039E6BB8F
MTPMHRHYPQYYEEAARLLQILVGKGVTIEQGIDPHLVILLLAPLCFSEIHPPRISTHAEQALNALEHLEAKHFICCDRKRRQKLVALIGTVIANHRAA